MEIGTVKQVDIQEEMQGAYLDYAMSVIVARALPDVRDGLKPVHRRILYAMHDMGLFPDRPYKKSARIVGEVLGKYHPHSDDAVYDAMVRMAQDFSLRYMLVDGQGNFGSIDGDNPAAMRYTEARLQNLAQEMLADIDRETVEFVPNFDDTLKEPAVLPAALPNLLVNGASGIAVGMATNVPPHNLAEICDALDYLLEHYDRAEEVTVEELMRFVKGPDFPTGGILYRFDKDSGSDREDVIARAYASGRGHFRVQARAHIEEMSRGRSRIVVTELPYQTNKTNLIERIADLAREARIEGISDLRDESDRTGMRIVIELTRTADARQVLADLYRLTPMQQTFGMSMLALVDGEPRTLSLRRVLQHYVEHRREIIRRRSEYELAKARLRAHILEGLLKALDNLDEVIQTIRRSESTDTARTNLMRKFKFTEVQAQAILDMPLKRLAGLERKRLREEYEALLQRITYLEDLLANPRKVLWVIRQELASLKERYGDARRTHIVEGGVSRQSLTMRDVIEEEPVLVSLGRNGLLLRESAADRRRGKLPNKVADDPPVAMVAGSSHDEILLFSASGHMGRVPVHRLPDGSEIHPSEFGLFNRNDRLVAVLIAARPDAGAGEGSPQYLILATREGRVKRVAFGEVWTVIGTPAAMNVEDGDELIGVAVSDDSSEIVLVTKLGQAIRFREAEVRPMGLPAAGVWGLKLGSGDEVVSVGVSLAQGELVIATTNGYFKRTKLEEYPIQGRHGNGVAAIRLGQISGAVAAAHVATPGDEFFSASRRGTLRKIDYQEIPLAKRMATGKLVVQPAQGDGIAKLLHLPVTRSRRRRSPGEDTSRPSSSRPSRASGLEDLEEAALEQAPGQSSFDFAQAAVAGAALAATAVAAGTARKTRQAPSKPAAAKARAPAKPAASKPAAAPPAARAGKAAATKPAAPATKPAAKTKAATTKPAAPAMLPAAKTKAAASKPATTTPKPVAKATTRTAAGKSTAAASKPAASAGKSPAGKPAAATQKPASGASQPAASKAPAAAKKPVATTNKSTGAKPKAPATKSGTSAGKGTKAKPSTATKKPATTSGKTNTGKTAPPK